jgi:hypothetical protein
MSNKWVNDIRRGDFASAEAELTQSAAQRVHMQMEERRVAEGVARINESAGEYSKYCSLGAVKRVHDEYLSGQIQTPDALLNRYASVLQDEVGRFEQTVQPGYKRSSYEPYIPAEKEVSDYVRARQQQQDALKAEGQRISLVTPNSDNRVRR